MRTYEYLRDSQCSIKEKFAAHFVIRIVNYDSEKTNLIRI